MLNTLKNPIQYNCLVFVIVTLFICPELQAQTSLVFKNVDDALAYAEENAVSVNVSREQYLLAKYDILMAKVQVLNPKGTVTASAIDNIKLPVNYLAGEDAGSTGGSQAVEFGMRYASSLSISPQIDIINLSAWEKLKSAKLSEQLARVNEQLALKTLLESVAAAYFNIVSTREQIKILQQNLANNDAIVTIVTNKYDQGQVRKQDVNQAEVNKLLIQDKISQLEYTLRQQINSLKVLCDIKDEQTLKVVHEEKTVLPVSPAGISNGLLSRQNQLEKEVAESELQASKKSLFPTLSLVGDLSWDDYSNDGFFDEESSSSRSSYIGVRISYDIPSVNYFSKNQKAQTTLKIAELDREHAFLEEKMKNKQLLLDYQKCSETLHNSERIFELKADTFTKNRDIYQQDLISTETLMVSLNDKINANLTHGVNTVNCQNYMTRILINQQIQ
jgi:OMF family outer membrane factor